MDWHNIIVLGRRIQLVGAMCLMRTQQTLLVAFAMSESAPWVVNCDERDLYNFWPPQL